MQIETLLAMGMALKCPMKADYYTAGILPDEDALEDRSAYWKIPPATGRKGGGEKETSSYEDEEILFCPGTLALFPHAWPPLHAWVAALLILLYENGFSKGFLYRQGYPTLQVKLTPKGKETLNALQNDRLREQIKNHSLCQRCPYIPWCDPFGE